jgi:hypothetical protein
MNRTVKRTSKRVLSFEQKRLLVQDEQNEAFVRAEEALRR